MLRAATRRLFPIHLAPIDAFFLTDDRPEYPMTFASNIYLTGELDREAFQGALEDAMDMHPLIGAIVGPGKQGKICWLRCENPTTLVDWGTYEAPVAFHSGEGIDLEQENGLRVWARVGEGRTRLVLQFHHACTDGTGAHRFIGDLLACYGMRTAEEGAPRPQLPTYDQQLLKGRRLKLADHARLLAMAPIIRRGIGQAYQVFAKRITPLAVTRSNPLDATPPEEAFPGVVSRRLDRFQYQALRERASKLGVMLNDLLTAEMFFAMRDWNLLHGGKPNQRLRIMMPSDMRDTADFAMSAANMTSYNFITRKLGPRDRMEKLVKSIRDETARIKNENRGKLFIDSIMVCNRVPGLLPYLLSGKRCLSTVTLSNMGDPTRRFLATFPRQKGKVVCGNLVLDHMQGVSPLRAMTRAAVSIVSLYKQMFINVRCDPHLMTLADSRQLLEIYTSRLEAHVKAELPEPLQVAEVATT
jgi:hypothetical protein